jgi:transcription-repair coupling factor (superfamily II helicase)
VDRFGLSQIYQLRGRVGRSKEHAYAYLLLSSGSRITREAEKRLKALMDFSHLGAGMHLAMHDLKIRGGGNILGFTQSGHIAAIGFELYMKLVEQAIAELKGETWREEIDPEINADMPAYLPGYYVSDTDVRLNLYRRLSSLSEESDLEVMEEEMMDRFGPPPEEVSNLLNVMSVRLLLKRMSVVKLEVSNEVLIFTFTPDTEIDPVRLVKLLEGHRHRYQFVSETKLKVNITKRASIEALLEAKRILEDFDHAQKDA